MFFFVFEDCDKPNKNLKINLLHYKIGLVKLPPIAKVMENQNFKCVYLRTTYDFLLTNLLKSSMLFDDLLEYFISILFLAFKE